MFRLAEVSDRIKWPVKLKLVDGKGKPAEKTFTAIFPRLTQAEIDEIVKKSQAKPGTDDDHIDDNEVARRVLVGWEDIEGDDGEALEFSEENRDKLLNISPVRPSVIKAWFESIAGIKTKN